jgi:hypothetical protein
MGRGIWIRISRGGGGAPQWTVAADRAGKTNMYVMYIYMYVRIYIYIYINIFIYQYIYINI